MKEPVKPKESKPVIKEKADAKPVTTTTKAKVKPDDNVFTYHYILSTPEQREAIDLTKHKAKLQEIITGFFSKRLISLEIQKDGYILTLKDSFPVGDKRMLGRLISTNSGLKQYVRTVSYNNKQDSSGQLFKFKKPDSNKTAEKATV